MVWICRVLMLLVFAIYWGGLTFYTGFVVRISHDVLNDPMDGGLITQRVTTLLQVLGVVAFVLMLCNALIVFRQSRRFGYALVGWTLLLGFALMGLFFVHAQLDAVIDVEGYAIRDREAFTAGHQRYNQLTTVQWIAALAYLPTTVLAWRRVDGHLGAKTKL